LRRLWTWIHDRWGWRVGVWWFVRRSVEVNVRRSCGHREQIRLLRKGLDMRLSVYRASPCPECNFYAVMKEFRERTLQNSESQLHT
jgi:uncharacterized protein (DUF2225 family)